MDGIEMYKTCNKCKIVKTINEFGKNKRKIDGIHTECKKCVNSYNQSRIVKAAIARDNKCTLNEKECFKCKTVKSIDNFHKNKNRYDGFYGNCKECVNESTSVWQKENKDIILNGRLIRTFGITTEQYNDLLKKQNGLCALCKKPETAVNNKRNEIKKLAIDHDHITGKNRGLLCSRCNTALGSFKESIEFLQAAINYINQWNIL